MTFRKMLLKDYLDSLSAATAIPGGGSAAALAGAMGAALGKMVCGITSLKGKQAGNKKLIQYKKVFHKNYNKLFSLSEKDCLAYQKVMNAYKLPKNTDAQIAKRRAKIQEALYLAMSVPFEGMEVSVENIKALARISKDIKDTVESDFVTAILLTIVALGGCGKNVLINAKSIKDNKINAHAAKRMKRLTDDFEKELAKLKPWL